MIVSYEHNVSHRVVQSNLHADQSGEVCPWILELTGRVNVLYSQVDSMASILFLASIDTSHVHEWGTIKSIKLSLLLFTYTDANLDLIKYLSSDIPFLINFLKIISICY